MSEQSASDSLRETHIGEDGLYIPSDLREFTGQIVIRTPKSTIQHFGSSDLDPYYGMVTAREFAPADELRDPKNPELAPDRVSIKPQGVEPVELAVDVDPDVRCDGGTEQVRELLNDVHGDRVFSVEDGVVWVSGMNQHCPRVARRMARMLVKHDIPAGLVHDDDAARNGGVQFRYGRNA